MKEKNSIFSKCNFLICTHRGRLTKYSCKQINFFAGAKRKTHERDEPLSGIKCKVKLPYNEESRNNA